MYGNENNSFAITAYDSLDHEEDFIKPIYGNLSQEVNLLDEVSVFFFRNLKQVASVGSMKLYWNPEIAKRVYDAIMSVDRIKPLHNKIVQLFKRKVIIPCYTHKNIFSTIFNKISNKLFDTFTVLAFFTSEKNKIFLILNGLSNIFFQVDEAKISRILIHELLHYSAFNKYNKFFSIFRKELFDWYKYYFCFLLNCDEDDTRVDKVINNIIKLIIQTERGKTIKNIYKSYKSEVLKLKKYTEEPKIFDKFYNLHFNAITAYFNDDMQYLDYCLEYLYKPMVLAYSDGMNLRRIPRTYPIQELFFASEIICCSSEIKITPKIISILNSL